MIPVAGQKPFRALTHFSSSSHVTGCGRSHTGSRQGVEMIALPDLVAEVVDTTPRKVLFVSANHRSSLRAARPHPIVSTSSHSLPVCSAGLDCMRQHSGDNR